MGCGDGALLKSVYLHIVRATPRGKSLDEAPLTMVGVDYHEAPRRETSKTLSEAGIPHLVIHGDIGDPQQMMQDLVSHNVTERILHIRSFLDHDRPFRAIEDKDQLLVREKYLTDHYTGQYVMEDGKDRPAAQVVQNLVDHLSRWADVLGDHGLVVLEVHSLEPHVSAEFLDMCAGLYFDACQSMSLQWLVEPRIWLEAAGEAGLFPRKCSLTLLPERLPYHRMTSHP